MAWFILLSLIVLLLVPCVLFSFLYFKYGAKWFSHNWKKAVAVCVATAVSTAGVSLIPLGNPSGGWWDTDWSYYKTCEVADKIDDYQMKILIDYDADVGGNVSCEGHCQADFDDLRFVYDNTTELPYWIKNVTVSTQATMWINISTYDKFEMFYGNDAVGNNSNFDDTFIFGELWDADNFDRWTSSDGNPAYTIDTINHYMLH